jgi:Transposase IS66 family
VVHADETRVTVDDKLGYVWVFTNVESVAYVHSDTRDASTPKMVLRNFAGVLISDFYSAYDCIDTAQQKCLVHLLRDINDDVLRHPFNDEMEQVARSFAGLIKPMIETIDRFGLKAWHLRKHKKAVESFSGNSRDAGIKLRLRAPIRNASKKTGNGCLRFLIMMMSPGITTMQSMLSNPLHECATS